MPTEEKDPAAAKPAEQPEQEGTEETVTTPTVPNPFEKGHSDLSEEEQENLELFKEAQTERD